MRRASSILLQFREYFLLCLYLVVSVTLLALNDNKQIRALRTIAVGSAAFMQNMFGFVPQYLDLREENTILRKQNLVLNEELSRLREAQLENMRLNKLLDLKQRPRFSYISAHVLANHLQLLRNTITLDVGEADGVRRHMPIVNELGLVGRIAETTRNYSIGQILLHKDIKVSAKIQRSRVDGILTWEGGDVLKLKNVAKTLDVKEGDVVLTSEYSSLFPPGIRMGVVSTVKPSSESLFLLIDVTPSVRFRRLEEVFVIRTVPDSGRITFEQRPSP